MNIENRVKPLDGRYHLVAVNKDGSRHPMDDTHFRDFRRMGPRVYFRMDVALADGEIAERGVSGVPRTFLREAQTGVNERTPTASRSVKPHNPLPFLIHHFVSESLWAQYLGETQEYLYPLFDNDRIGGSGAANGHVTLHFMSNRPFLGDSRALHRMEEQFCVVDAMNGHPVVAPSDHRDPAKFAAWLETQSAGDFGLSRTAGDSLVAVRGAKLALLNVENWIQADAIHDEALREIIERQNQEQIELTSYHKSWQGAMSGFTGPYVGILTKEGRLAVVHVEDFTGPEEIMNRVRARPSNEASAETATSLRIAASTIPAISCAFCPFVRWTPGQLSGRP